MFYCFLQQTGTDPKPGKCVQVPLVAVLFWSRLGWTGRSRGPGQRDVSQRRGSLVLLARSRICSPAAGDDARVESYVCSFISKQPKNSITFSSKQAKGEARIYTSLYIIPRHLRVCPFVSDAGLCFCGVHLTQVNEIVWGHLKLTNRICSISAGWKCLRASWERQRWQPFSEWNVSTRSDVPPRYGIDITSAEMCIKITVFYFEWPQNIPPSPSKRGPRLLCMDTLCAIVMQSTVITVIIIVICFFGWRMRGSLAFMTEMSRRWSLYSLAERQCGFVHECMWARESIIKSDALERNY